MNYTQWNAFDWLLVAIVLISVVLAFRRGLVRAIFGLLGIIGGFLMATWTYTTVGEWVTPERLHLPLSAERVFGFLLVVVLVSVALEFAGWGMQKLLRQVGLGPFDRLLGAGFGFARGCMVALAVLMGVTTFAPQSEFVTTSVLTPYLFAVSHDVSFLVPQYVQQLMMNGAFDFKHNPPRWINPS